MYVLQAGVPMVQNEIQNGRRYALLLKIDLIYNISVKRINIYKYVLI